MVRFEDHVKTAEANSYLGSTRYIYSYLLNRPQDVYKMFTLRT